MRYIFQNDNFDISLLERAFFPFTSANDSRVHSHAWSLELSHKNIRISLRGVIPSFFSPLFKYVRGLSQRQQQRWRTLHYEIGMDVLYFATQVLNARRWYTHALYPDAFHGFGALGRKRFPRCLQKGTQLSRSLT